MSKCVKQNEMGKTIRRKSLQAMLNMCQEEEEGGGVLDALQVPTPIANQSRAKFSREMLLSMKKSTEKMQVCRKGRERAGQNQVCVKEMCVC